MHRITTMLLALVSSTPALPAESPAESSILWGCAQGGERRNVLYLADRGMDSYVKVGTQRVDAILTVGNGEQRWTFGPNHISLKPDGLAEYFERGALKGRFRCREMG